MLSASNRFIGVATNIYTQRGARMGEKQIPSICFAKSIVYHNYIDTGTNVIVLYLMLNGLTQQSTRFRGLSQLLLAVPAMESGVKLVHTNHIL